MSYVSGSFYPIPINNFSKNLLVSTLSAAHHQQLVSTMILLVGPSIALLIWIPSVVTGLVLLIIPKVRFLSAHLIIAATVGAVTANVLAPRSFTGLLRWA